MTSNLLFIKHCKNCNVRVELYVCITCNFFVDICSECLNDLINQYFQDYSNTLIYDETLSNSLQFISMITRTSDNQSCLCRKCIQTGIYQIDLFTNIKYLNRIRSLVNRYLKNTKNYVFLDIKKNIKNKIN
jgi:hypothetical protein